MTAAPSTLAALEESCPRLLEQVRSGDAGTSLAPAKASNLAVIERLRAAITADRAALAAAKVSLEGDGTVPPAEIQRLEQELLSAKEVLSSTKARLQLAASCFS